MNSPTFSLVVISRTNKVLTEFPCAVVFLRNHYCFTPHLTRHSVRAKLSSRLIKKIHLGIVPSNNLANFIIYAICHCLSMLVTPHVFS